jgi:hypothetical protein
LHSNTGVSRKGLILDYTVEKVQVEKMVSEILTDQNG